jgi:hypothetical protein
MVNIIYVRDHIYDKYFRDIDKDDENIRVDYSKLSSAYKKVYEDVVDILKNGEEMYRKDIVNSLTNYKQNTIRSYLTRMCQNSKCHSKDGRLICWKKDNEWVMKLE